MTLTHTEVVGRLMSLLHWKEGEGLWGRKRGHLCALCRALQGTQTLSPQPSCQAHLLWWAEAWALLTGV